MLLELHLAHKIGYTKRLEIKSVIKIEYFEEKSMNGTGTKAQLKRDRMKQIIGDTIKKIMWALSASTICLRRSFLLSITVCTTP